MREETLLRKENVAKSVYSACDSGSGSFAKYQSPKETGTARYTDKPEKQKNTQLPTVIDQIIKSNT